MREKPNDTLWKMTVHFTFKSPICQDLCKNSCGCENYEKQRSILNGRTKNSPLSFVFPRLRKHFTLLFYVE